MVTVSSFVHRQGRIDLGNLPLGHGYRRSAAYSRSKLANLLFTYELQRRLAQAGAADDALAAHPGYAAHRTVAEHVAAVLRLGALVVEPVVRAERRNGRAGSSCCGRPPIRARAAGNTTAPAGCTGMRGYPDRTRVVGPGPYDADLQRRLWAESERLTGVSYPL